MTSHYKVVATCARAVVYHMGFLTKLQEQRVGALNDGNYAIICKSTLKLSNMGVRVSEMKKHVGLAHAPIHEVASEDGLREYAAIQEECPSSSNGSGWGAMTSRPCAQNALVILGHLTAAEQHLVCCKMAMLRASSCVTTQRGIHNVNASMQDVVNAASQNRPGVFRSSRMWRLRYDHRSTARQRTMICSMDFTCCVGTHRCVEA